TADGEIAELFTGNPRHRGRYVNRADVVGQGSRTINAESKLIQERRRECMPPFRGRILIAAALCRIGDRRLVYRDSIDLSVIEGVPRGQRIVAGEVVINAALNKMFIRRLRA